MYTSLPHFHPFSLSHITPSSFLDFALHLSTNTIGPIIIAQKLLNAIPNVASSPLFSTSSSYQTIPIQTIAFISSDSGSATNFRDFEDGFGAYAASKAALNQMLRHMAAELKRKQEGQGQATTVLALHPGEVQT
jgi:NAD(P)-dependent dehydrogenase (short-subunit alcohol dehydrogenase family)